MKINLEDNKIFWTLNDKIISVEINDVFLYTFNPSNKLIIVQSGKNFILNKLSAFRLDGTLFFELLVNQELNWFFEGENYTFTNSDVKQVIFNIESSNFILLSKNTSRGKIFVVSITAEIICTIESSDHEQFDYIEQNNSQILVVVSNLSKSDDFGRCQFNYSLDLKTCLLKEEGIAY